MPRKSARPKFKIRGLRRHLKQLQYPQSFKSPDEQSQAVTQLAALGEFIRSDSPKMRWSVDLQRLNITDEMLIVLGDAETASKIVHLNILQNRITEKSLTALANIYIESTITNNLLPQINYAPKDMPKTAATKLQEIRGSLRKFIQADHALKITAWSGTILSILVGATMIAFAGASLAVAAGLTWPIFTALASAAAVVGGSMGITLISIACLGAINLTNIGLQSVFEAKKIKAFREANYVRSNLTGNATHKPYTYLSKAKEIADEAESASKHHRAKNTRSHDRSATGNSAGFFAAESDSTEQGLDDDATLQLSPTNKRHH